MEENQFSINGNVIERGQNTEINLSIGKLPSGNRISIKTHVYSAEEEGPNILFLAGLHGDEINGVEILRRALMDKIFEKLKRGTVIAVPVLNVYGFINFSREVANGKDVNRSFPGSLKGSMASRIAKNISHKILPLIDFGVDFHTGAESRYNYPQIRFTKSDINAKELGKIFNAPFLIEKALIRKSLRSTAKRMNKSILVFEGGESLRLDGFSIEVALRGIKRLLHHFRMIDVELPQSSSIYVPRTGWVRAKHSGVFIWSKSSGEKVLKGESLGAIYDPHGSTKTLVTANRNGYIIGHNNQPVVHQGDALFHIGYQHETET